MTPAHDVRYAARALRRAPGFAFSVLLTVALGIGAAVPMLGVVLAGRARPALDDVPPVVELAAGGGRVAWGPEVRTAARVAHEGTDALLAVLLGLTGAALAIACVNLALLLLARASARRHEMAVRAALGAGRGRVARQLLTEGGLLGGTGAAAGIALGAAGAYAVRGSWPEGLAPFPGGAVSAGAVGIAAGALAGAVVLFGLAPAASAARRGPGAALGAGGRATAGPLEAKVRNGLMVLAVGCSTVLLVGTGLLVRGAAPAAERSDAGIDPRDTLTMRVELPAGADPALRAALLGRIVRGVEAVPGARAASVSDEGAWTGTGTEDWLRALCLGCWRGFVSSPVWEARARHHVVSPGFFRAHGVPLLAGRELTAADRAGSADVAVINRTAAYRVFPNGDPLGKRVRVGPGGARWYTVVGVAADVRPRGVGSAGRPVPAVYLSALQHPPAAVGLAVRAAGDPLRLEGAVRAAVRTAAPGARVGEAETMEAVLARYAAPLRWFGRLFGVLAAAAVVLAGMGVYGVTSYNVLRRTREVGVRMALGARGREVVGLVVGSAARMTAWGGVLGLWGALSLARLLEVRFRGVDSLDLPVYAAVALLLGGLAVAGSWVPARRATRVDPVVALRAE